MEIKKVTLKISFRRPTFKSILNISAFILFLAVGIAYVYYCGRASGFNLYRDAYSSPFHVVFALAYYLWAYYYAAKYTKNDSVLSFKNIIAFPISISFHAAFLNAVFTTMIPDSNVQVYKYSLVAELNWSWQPVITAAVLSAVLIIIDIIKNKFKKR